MRYVADINIRLKKGVRDPEGATIQQALANLGFVVVDVSTAKKFYVTLDASDEAEASELIDKMCTVLLSNPIIHDYDYKISPQE